MRGTRTSDEVFEKTRQFALSMDVLPLVVQKDSTGFIINRVWRAVKREALRVVAEGVASPDDVDRAWVMMMGGPMGPLRAHGPGRARRGARHRDGLLQRVRRREGRPAPVPPRHGGATASWV